MESSLIKSLSEKNRKIRFCLEVGVAQLDRAVIVQFRGVAVAVSQHPLRPAVHIANIHFDLNYSINNFDISYYYCCRQLNTIH